MACITIVDESRLDRMLAAGLLRSNREFHFGFAEHGQEALEKVDGAPPDLAITSLDMPVMDGVELIRRMGERFPNVPMIAMGAHEKSNSAIESLCAGAVSYVPKHQRAEQLKAVVDCVLSHLSVERERTELEDTVRELHCTFMLADDPQLISPLVEEIQRLLASICMQRQNERIQTVIALEEVLHHAVFEGDGRRPSHDTDENGPPPPFDRSQLFALPPRSQKVIAPSSTVLEAHLALDGARFTLTGNFCARSAYTDGSILVQTAIDEVHYHEARNELTLVKRSH